MTDDDVTDDEQNERDDADTPAAEDHYDRSNAPRGADAAVKALWGELGFDGDFTAWDESRWAEVNQRCKELDAKQAAEAERTRMRRRAADLIDRGGFPRMGIEAALVASIETPALRYARVFQHLPSSIFVFAGGTGAGKTVATCWLTLKAHDHTPGFVRASELERRGRYDKKLDEWLKSLSSLVIDDLGVEVVDSKRIFASLLDEIVDNFQSRHRPLILTTNLLGRVPNDVAVDARARGETPAPQFVERYGERIRSRVRQVGQWADCGMLDLRRPWEAQA